MSNTTDSEVPEPSAVVKQNDKKRSAEQAELEVDLAAPEPPSKKALRKAKKSKHDNSDTHTATPNIQHSKTAGNAEVTKEDANNFGKRSDYGIWIGNLSFTTTREDLFQFMSSDTEYVIPKEQVTRVNLPAGRSRNGQPQNKGFAYIDLANAAALAKALELSEKLLAGRRVLIKDAKNFEGRPAEGKKESSSHPPSKRIFIGNLGFDTTIEDLEKHFAVCGPITHTHMATFEDSGKCKGYAWVEFEELSSSQTAMRGWIEEGGQQDTTDDGSRRSKRRIWLHTLEGRKLRLEYAEDKAIRYQKRYGKDAKKAGPSDIEGEELVDTTNEHKSNIPRRSQAVPSTPDDRDLHAKRQKVRKNGYAEDTVKRLTGAIVEGKGSKVTFA